MPVRRELGIRTMFNILGPLVNPARPTHYFLGVPRPEMMELVAQTLAISTQSSGAVVCGAGNYDELTPIGEAHVTYIANGTTRNSTIHPGDFGFSTCTPQDLAITGPEHGATVLRELLTGGGPIHMQEMLILNVAMALHILAPSTPLTHTVQEAKQAVTSGVGRRFTHA